MRLVVGAIFVYAGMAKVGDPQAFAGDIARYELTPAWFNAPAARFLPWLEILAGIGLIAGALTRGSAWLVAGMNAVFAAAMISVLARGLSISCGCFGPGEGEVSWLHVAASVAMLGVCLAVALGDWDPLRLDRRLAGRLACCAWLFDDAAPGGKPITQSEDDAE